MDLDTYWETTPIKFQKFLEVYKELREEEAKIMDVNNFNLGNYIAIAFNDPKNYPKKPFLWEEERKGEIMTNKEMERVMKRNTIILGGKINGTNK